MTMADASTGCAGIVGMLQAMLQVITQVQGLWVVSTLGICPKKNEILRVLSVAVARSTRSTRSAKRSWLFFRVRASIEGGLGVFRFPKTLAFLELPRRGNLL